MWYVVVILKRSTVGPMPCDSVVCAKDGRALFLWLYSSSMWNCGMMVASDPTTGVITPGRVVVLPQSRPLIYLFKSPYIFVMLVISGQTSSLSQPARPCSLSNLLCQEVSQKLARSETYSRYSSESWCT